MFRWNGRDYSSSTSIGVVMLEAGSTLRDVFAHADAACYLAKEAGRNRIHLYARNDAAIQLRLGEMEWVPKIQAALREGSAVQVIGQEKKAATAAKAPAAEASKQ